MAIGEELRTPQLQTAADTDMWDNPVFKYYRDASKIADIARTTGSCVVYNVMDEYVAHELGIDVGFIAKNVGMIDTCSRANNRLEPKMIDALDIDDPVEMYESLSEATADVSRHNIVIVKGIDAIEKFSTPDHNAAGLIVKLLKSTVSRPQVVGISIGGLSKARNEARGKKEQPKDFWSQFGSMPYEFTGR